VIRVSGYYSGTTLHGLEIPPMLTAPDVRADEPSPALEMPRFARLASPVDRAEPAGPPAVPQSSPTGITANQAPTPSEPTVRIHWVGTLGALRHPADLYADIVAGTPNLVVVDARYPEAYAREHLPGAMNLPSRELNETTTAHLPREALYVVYCWNASCHASTKTARRLEALGFKVNELHGGLETWRKQGYPTERG
jgi:rhodanese-related sulfurtransferase